MEHHDLRPEPGKKLSVSIVTPQGSILARDVDELVLPGLLGELGILPGHVPLLAALKAGVLTWRAGDDSGVFAVGPGYAQVGALDRVQVLVSRAIEAGDVDVDAAQTELDESAAELKTMSPEDEGFADKQSRWQWARARIDASGRTTEAAKPKH